MPRSDILLGFLRNFFFFLFLFWLISLWTTLSMGKPRYDNSQNRTFINLSIEKCLKTYKNHKINGTNIKNTGEGFGCCVCIFAVLASCAVWPHTSYLLPPLSFEMFFGCEKVEIALYVKIDSQMLKMSYLWSDGQQTNAIMKSYSHPDKTLRKSTILRMGKLKNYYIK